MPSSVSINAPLAFFSAHFGGGHNAGKLVEGHDAGEVLVSAVAVAPAPGGPTHVEIWNTEEKDSDVNLASYLIHDAWQIFDVPVSCL